jgi:hypothetical protein
LVWPELIRLIIQANTKKADKLPLDEVMKSVCDKLGGSLP